MDEHIKLITPSLQQRVIYSRTGGGAGSIWLITFENGTSLWISCAWRLEKDGVVLATNTDNAAAIIGRMAVNVSRLEEEGVRLLSYKLSKLYDLTLCFEHGYCVRIFCDQAEYLGSGMDDEYCENWHYSIKDENLSITVSSAFRILYGKYFSCNK